MKHLYFIAVFFALSAHPAQVAAQLYIQKGASLNCGNNALICLQNSDLINSGTVSLQPGSGRIMFAGNTDNYISGDSTCTFDELDIAKSGSSLLLSQNININSRIQFDSGLVDLNGKNIYLLQPTTLLVNENENSRITGLSGGSVSAGNPAVNTPALYNIGNLGAAITSSQDLGSLHISRSHSPATAGASSGIQRIFLIQPSNDNALSATLRFYYFDAELNGRNKNTLALWKSADGNTWSFVGADNNDVADGYVEKTSINDFSYWTLSDASDPLPLTLISFSATCQNNHALLKWQTANEQDIKTFIIERSSDGQHWNDEGAVAAGNSMEGAAYEWNDPGASGETYYRLKIESTDGTFSYSPVFAGGCNDISMPFVVYPNPAESQATVRVSVRQSTKAALLLLTTTGQVLEVNDWDLQTGVNSRSLPGLAKLAAGAYIVQLKYDGRSLQQTLIKK